MPYVGTKEILDKANREGYGVAAFNINNLEFLQAIVEAGVEERSPIIIETSEGALEYAGRGDPLRGAFIFYHMVKTYADSVDIPISLHLDHGKRFDRIMAAIRAGYTSVMIDASHMPFEENMAETKKIVEIAHAVGISVEAELGRLVGIEDNVKVSEREAVLVNPEEAEVFVEKTKVDFLAPAIGTSHGAFKFKGEPKLDFERLKEVKKRTGIPLVLHGASSVPQELIELANSYGAEIEGAKGIPTDMLKESVKYGINKVNTDTDLRMAFMSHLRKTLSEKKKEFDPRKLLKPSIEAIKEVVKERMRILGSAGKA